MQTYCFSCKKYTLNKNSSDGKTKQNRSNCAVCGKEKLTFNKKIKNSAILINLKMNKIIDKFFLAGDKFMPELNLKQPRFTYCAFGAFKPPEKIQKI